MQNSLTSLLIRDGIVTLKNVYVATVILVYRAIGRAWGVERATLSPHHDDIPLLSPLRKGG